MTRPVPVLRSLLLALGAAVALTAILWPHGDEMRRAIESVPAGAIVTLTALHLLALVLRAEAWALCVDSAGAPVRRAVLHPISGLRFLADTIVPTYVGAWVRIVLLRRLEPKSAPTIGQMILADGIMLAVEAGILVVIVCVAVLTEPVPWWWAPLMIAVAAILLGACLFLRRRYAGSAFARTFEVLSDGRRRTLLIALLIVVLVIQPIRLWIAIDAVGVDASAAQAVLAFVTTSLFGALPIGPGPASVSAVAAIFHDTALGRSAAAAIVLAATAVMAAGVYSLWGAVLLVRRSVGVRTP